MAHQVIRANKKWQEQILYALKSCDALLYICTKDSNRSHWCQQEIGIAFAREILVLTYAYKAQPVGFLSPRRSIKVPDHAPQEISDELRKVLLQDEKTEPAMHGPIRSLLESATDGECFKSHLKEFTMLKSPSQDLLDRVSSMRSQPFITSDIALQKELDTVLTMFGFKLPTMQSEVPDDYDPFGDD